MKKKILCLAMIAMMVLGIPMTANAEVIKGSQDWVVTYEKNGITSNFKGVNKEEDMLQNLQPGDTVELKIKLENISEKKSDWYMTNEVLQSLEDGTNASGGAYTYILTYTDPAGKEIVIYSNERVGGEIEETNARSTSETLVGLKQATNTLDDHFYLDRLNAGEAGYVNLSISLDGETQGNAYQTAFAELEMDFAVESVKEVTHKEVEKVETPKKVVQREVVTTATTAAKTGDASQIALFSAVAFVSGVALMVVAVKQAKGRKKGESS